MHALCAIYGPIWKHADLIFGKKGLNVPTVKQFSENKFNIFWVLFMPFSFTSYLKVNIYRTRATITRSWLETALEY
jgi:hypothetical protein